MTALNRQLKTHVRLYQEVALRLTETIPAVLGNSSIETALTVPVVTVNSWDVEMMHRLARETLDMRAEVDAKISNGPAIQLAPGSSYAAQQQWQCDDVPGNEMLEISEAMSMPFDLDLVVEALQRVLLKMYGQECTPVVLTDAEDLMTVIAKVHFSSFTDVEGSIFYESMFSSRVFMEEDRVTHTWRSVIREGGTQGDWQSAVHAVFSYWGAGVQNVSDDHNTGSSMRFLSRMQLNNYKHPMAGGGPQDESLRLYIKHYGEIAEEEGDEFMWSIESEIMDSKK